jgi:hypothetical protein
VPLDAGMVLSRGWECREPTDSVRQRKRLQSVPRFPGERLKPKEMLR